MKIEKRLNNILDRFSLSNDEKEEFASIVDSIYNHEEFQKRMNDDFLHHGKTTLGEHILEDAIITYKVSKKKYEKKDNYDTSLAVKIAMMHDLYEEPWQNNKNGKVNSFFHLHGFRHPIEAAINSAVWFSDEFKDKETARKIIDGIVHHMYPLPVSSVKNFDDNYLELRNYNQVSKLDDDIKDLIIESTRKKKIGSISITRSKYKEGRVMSNADKRSAVFNLKSTSDAVALVTGKNKRLKK